MDGKKIREQQEYYVVKSNELIQKARYNLTVQQQKLVLYCISKIKLNDDSSTLYEFSIDEVCSVLNLPLDEGGTYYKRLKEDFIKLTSRSWVTFPDKSEGTFSWFSDAYVIPLSGTVQVRFHEKMAPYLFELKNRYTQYQLYEVLVFKNKYAIRLYEIIRSFIMQDELREGTVKDIKFSIDELRELLSAPQYKRWVDFNRFVLKPAVDEINKLSDLIRLEYQPVKNHTRNFETLFFTVSYPTIMEKFISHNEQRKRLI